jgi:hypothetical protein
MEFIKQVLAIYSWAIIVVLIAFLWRVAQFYQRASGQRLGHYLVVVPAVLLVAGVIHYTVLGGEFIGHPTGDVLLFSGGVALILFGARMLEMMTGEP